MRNQDWSLLSNSIFLQQATYTQSRFGIVKLEVYVSTWVLKLYIKIKELFVKEEHWSTIRLPEKKNQLVEKLLGPLQFYKLRLDQYN